MRSKRTPYEIVWQILDYCRKPRKLTQIIQACNLNTSRAKKYLELLISKEMLSKNEEKYKTAKKGLNYLNLMQEVYQALFS